MTPLERAASLPLWTGPVEPEALAGGMTNLNFVVRDAGRRYLVRIGGDIPEHGVLRRFELAAARAASGDSGLVALRPPPADASSAGRRARARAAAASRASRGCAPASRAGAMPARGSRT